MYNKVNCVVLHINNVTMIVMWNWCCNTLLHIKIDDNILFFDNQGQFNVYFLIVNLLHESVFFINGFIFHYSFGFNGYLYGLSYFCIPINVCTSSFHFEGMTNKALFFYLSFSWTLAKILSTGFAGGEQIWENLTFTCLFYSIDKRRE